MKAWLDVVSVGVTGDVCYVTGENVVFLDSDADVQYLMATSDVSGCPQRTSPDYLGWSFTPRYGIESFLYASLDLQPVSC